MTAAHTPALGAILLCMSFASHSSQHMKDVFVTQTLRRRDPLWNCNMNWFNCRCVIIQLYPMNIEASISAHLDRWTGVWGYYGYGGPSSKPEALGPIAYSAYSYYMYILHYKCLYRVNAVLMNIVFIKVSWEGGGGTQLPQIIKQHNCFQNGL